MTGPNQMFCFVFYPKATFQPGEFETEGPTPPSKKEGLKGGVPHSFIHSVLHSFHKMLSSAYCYQA